MANVGFATFDNGRRFIVPDPLKRPNPALTLLLHWQDGLFRWREQRFAIAELVESAQPPNLIPRSSLNLRRKRLKRFAQRKCYVVTTHAFGQIGVSFLRPSRQNRAGTASTTEGMVSSGVTM